MISAASQIKIVDTPEAINAYNTYTPANPALPADATVVAELGGAYDFTTDPAPNLAGVDSIDLNTFSATMTVDQADLVVASSGTYTVVDTAAEIEAEVTDSTAGSLDGATSVATTDGDDADAVADTLTLTVAEYGQIVDGDTKIGRAHV